MTLPTGLGRALAIIFVLYTIAPAFAAAPAREPQRFTSPAWPPTRKGCMRKALGNNPDPAYLSACFYAWDELVGEDAGFRIHPRNLLNQYATPSFRAALDADEESFRTTVHGVGNTMVFYLFDEFKGLIYDFHVIGATFDSATGLAEVRTTLRGFNQNLYVRFIRQGTVWRVDDILPHYDRDQNGKTLRDYLSVYVPWRDGKR